MAQTAKAALPTFDPKRSTTQRSSYKQTGGDHNNRQPRHNRQYWRYARGPGPPHSKTWRLCQQIVSIRYVAQKVRRQPRKPGARTAPEFQYRFFGFADEAVRAPGLIRVVLHPRARTHWIA